MCKLAQAARKHGASPQFGMKEYWTTPKYSYYGKMILLGRFQIRGVGASMLGASVLGASILGEGITKSMQQILKLVLRCLNICFRFTSTM